MALRKFLILRKPRSGCLEGRTALIQPIDNSFTGSQDEVSKAHLTLRGPEGAVSKGVDTAKPHFPAPCLMGIWRSDTGCRQTAAYSCRTGINQRVVYA